MSNYNSLKTTIAANIKQNGRQEITGQILNSVLNQMVDILGTGYQFAGVATIDTNPGTQDAKVFYIANGKGTYTNFGGINVTEDEVVVLYWDTAWHKEATGIASQAKLTELGEKIDGVNTTTDEFTIQPSLAKIFFDGLTIKQGDAFSIKINGAANGRLIVSANNYNIRLQDNAETNTEYNFIASADISTIELGNYTSGDVSLSMTLLLSGIESDIEKIKSELDSKVNKENGKGLSTNDFTDTYKSRVDGSVSKIPIEKLVSGWIAGAMNADGTISTSIYGCHHAEISASKGDKLEVTMPYDFGLGKVVIVRKNGSTYSAEYSLPDVSSTYEYTFKESGIYIINYRAGSTSYDGSGVKLYELSLNNYIEDAINASDANNAPYKSLAGYESMRASAENLTNGFLYVSNYPSYHRGNAIVSVFANISSFNMIRVGVQRNPPVMPRLALDIDETYITVMFGATKILDSVAHGLTITSFISVSLDMSIDGMTANIATASGSFRKAFDAEHTFYKSWNKECDFEGMPYIYADAETILTNVALSGCSRKFKCPVWYVGDSYTSIAIKRWTYQMMVEMGYSDFCLIGLSGGNSQDLYNDLLKALKLGTPKYLVWGLGMNDGDTTTSVNASWKTYFDKVKLLCAKNGITLIGATIPNVPTISNYYKNAIVRADGIRYIDFAKAVNAEEVGSTWYDGMLEELSSVTTARIHPTELGAKALAMRAMTDCPELIRG